MRRLAIVVTVMTTAVSLGVTIADASPVSQVTTAPHAAVSSVKSPGRITGTRAAEYLRTTPRSAAAPRVAHLDPRLQNALPASGNTVSVAVSGDTAQAAAHVTALGGRVLAAAGGEISAIVPRGALVPLAGSPGVTSVTPPVRAVELTTSEGVAASGAGTWQNNTPTPCAGECGAGVKVGIVDAGFGTSQTMYTDEVNAGNLGTSPQLANENCTDNTSSPNPYVDQHGLAVAEIVHQMAPQAQLFLYCVADNVGFASAEAAIEAAGVKIVNSSLGFPGDSRGDGSGASNSTATTVKSAREHGILWIQSAGNEGIDHWGGTLADSNNDGLLDVNGPNSEVDYVVVKYGGSASFILQWDNWPTSNIGISLNFAPSDSTGNPLPGTLQIVSQNPGTSPVLGACFEPGGGGSCIDSTSRTFFPNGTNQLFGVTAGLSGAFPHVRFDFSYYGEVSSNQFACSTFKAGGGCQTYNPKAATQSMSEPASSPFALAVGAANVGDGTTAAGTLEPFSSQGPTIDGRTKPDITGWDAVSSNLPEFSGRFYGTSSAAPHVAGAAALVSAANPSMDAAQIQTFLEQRADSGKSLNSGAPLNPPTNQYGHGLLTLGPTPTATPVAPPVPVGYTAVAPVRLLDTRVSNQQLNGSSSLAVSVAGQVPAGTTAVAINFTGVNASASTAMSVYPGPALPPSSNLNLSVADPTAAVFAIVTLNPATGSFMVHNGAGRVDVVIDLLGYFDPSGAGKFTSLTPHRVLDTRTAYGGSGPMGGDATVTVDPGVPGGSVAAVVNVTATDASGAGYLRVSPTCSGTTSTLNYNRRTRANMAVVMLSGGTFCITAHSWSTDVIVDVLGYVGPSGAGYVALPSPVRIMDTRYGNQSPVGAVGTQAQRTLFGAGIFGVPYSASALMIGVIGVSNSSVTYLSVFPGTSLPNPPTSTLNQLPAEVVPNAAIAGVDANRQFSVYNRSGTNYIVVDLFGYFV